MLEFQRLCPCQREKFASYFEDQPEKGCEYSMVNIMAWGRQRVHFGETYLTIFSQFDRASVYPFPVGRGDVKPVLDLLWQDAPFFLLKLRYDGDKLVEAVLNGQKIR